jgi:aspartate/methionine/tyrosine aminotransferase
LKIQIEAIFFCRNIKEKRSFFACMVRTGNKKSFPHLSSLVEESLCGLSPIQTIMKMAEERNIVKMGLNPEEVISFGGGWCNHQAPESLRNAYKEIVENKTYFHKSGRYSAIAGDYNCREQLARFEKNIYGVKGLQPSNILLGHSSTQLFHDILRVLCNAGDDICFLDPTYANYVNAVKCALPGSKMRFIPALESNTWEYLPNPDHSLEVLKSCCDKGARVFVIPVPDNPTSQIPNDEFLKGSLEILEDHDGFLILDYAYKSLWFGKMPQCFSWSSIDMPNLVTIHSNSKWLSGLGRRLGWIEADVNVTSGLEKLNESVLLSPDTMHSMATARFLGKTLEDRSLRSFIDETRHLYEKTAAVMIDSIDDCLGWNRLKPQGGLYTCCPTPEGEEPVGFVERVLKNTGVLLIPGKGFGPSMEQAVRLSYGPLCYGHELIKEGMERIGCFLSKSKC